MREEEIVSDIFSDAAPERDGVLMVHSGFRKLSHAGCDAAKFIEELQAIIPSGTLLMPTFTWRTVTRENNVFDARSTPSITGALTEVFRTDFATHRSLHPTHSTCACGPLSNQLLGEHHTAVTPCSETSPFAKLADVDAYILLLGVNLDSCTLIHVGEELVAPEFYMRPDIEDYRCIDLHGDEHLVRTRRHMRHDRQFTKFASPLNAKQQLFSGDAAGAEWQLFRAKDLHAEVLTTLADDLHGTLNQEK